MFGSSKRTAGGIRGEQHELWSHPMECLKLTVRELSHICQVFSRAEIEKYHSQTNLYKQLTKVKYKMEINKYETLRTKYASIVKYRSSHGCSGRIRARSASRKSAKSVFGKWRRRLMTFWKRLLILCTLSTRRRTHGTRRKD